MEVYKAKRKKVIEGREKPLWIDVAFTLLIGEYEGRTTYSLVDERTGERYNLYKLDRNKDWGNRPAPVDVPEDYTAVAPPVDGEPVPF